MYNYIKKFFSLISGMLLAASFTFSGVNILCFFALIPFMLRIFECLSSAELRRETIVFSYGYYLPLLSWLYGIYDLLPFSETVGVILLIVLSLILPFLFGLVMYAATAAFINVRRFSFGDIYRYAVLFCFGEYLLEIFPLFSFPWGRIGTITAVFRPFIQSASLFGGLFLSFLVISANGAAAYIIMNIRQINISLIKNTAIIICILLGNISYGYIRIANYDEDDGTPINAVLVQGNYSGRIKWETPPEVMADRYFRLSEAALQMPADIVVYPETAAECCLGTDECVTIPFRKLSRDSETVILTGINCRISGDTFNSAAAFEPDGTVSEPYFKQQLVPFGEYIPIIPEGLVSGYSGYADGMVSFPIETSAADIGTVICYESVYPNISRKTVKNGAEILAVITNDSWFDSTRALDQHLAHSVMRAVETDRWTLRAANTAVTAVISPTGEITASAPEYTACALRAGAQLKQSHSLYVLFGDITVIPGIRLIAEGLSKKKSAP